MRPTHGLVKVRFDKFREAVHVILCNIGGKYEETATCHSMIGGEYIQGKTRD